MPDESSGPLGDALRRFLQQQGLEHRVDQVAAVETWARVVGPAVAAAPKARSVGGDGTLVVGVRSSAWMNELSMMERELLEAVNGENPAAQIRRIRWQLVP
jgi:predicted nucleic acid-binding Zn ribbon protein